MAFDVSTVFGAVDRISPFFKKAAKSSTLFGDRATKAFNKASRAGSGFSSIFKGVTAANLVTRGFAQATRGAATLKSEFFGLDDAIFAAAAKFKDINLRTAEGRAKMQQLRDAAREVGGATEFTAAQAAKGLDFLALAGFESATAISFLPGVVDLATNAQLDLARTTDIASDALGAYGLRSDDVAEIAKNFAKQNDLLVGTFTTANVSLEDLFESLKLAGAPLTGMGQSMETINALIGTLGGAAIKGSLAGTQLRSSMARLATGLPVVERSLRKLNVGIQDAEGHWRDFIEILADTEKGLVGIASVEKSKLLVDIFGLRALPAINTFLLVGVDNLRAYRDSLLDVSGASTTMAAFMRQSLGNIEKAMFSALIEKGFQVFTKFQKGGTDAFKKLIKSIREFDVAPIVATLRDMLAAAVSLKKGLTPLFEAAFPAGIIAVRAFAKVVEFLGPALPVLVAGFLAYKTALIVSTVAQWSLNAAMIANPIGAVIAGITLLVAAAFWLVSNWETVSEVLLGVWDSIRGGFAIVINNVVSTLTDAIRFILKSVGFVAGLFGIDSALISGALKGLDVIDKKIKATLPSESLIVTGAVRVANTFAAPSQEEIENQQKSTFVGELNINGAPPGSKVFSESKGPIPFQVNLAGENP